MGFVKFSYFLNAIPIKSIGSVLRLLFFRNPPAIAWLITQGVVNSINRQVFFVSILIRPFIKVSKCIPFLANFYVCAAILGKARRVRVIASLLNSMPNAIKPCAAVVVRCERLFGAARAAVIALICFVTASIENALTPKASKFKVFSVGHGPLLCY